MGELCRSKRRIPPGENALEEHITAARVRVHPCVNHECQNRRAMLLTRSLVSAGHGTPGNLDGPILGEASRLRWGTTRSASLVLGLPRVWGGRAPVASAMGRKTRRAFHPGVSGARMQSASGSEGSCVHSAASPLKYTGARFWGASRRASRSVLNSAHDSLLRLCLPCGG